MTLDDRDSPSSLALSPGVGGVGPGGLIAAYCPCALMAMLCCKPELEGVSLLLLRARVSLCPSRRTFLADQPAPVIPKAAGLVPA